MACKVQTLHMASVLRANVTADATKPCKGSKGASSNTVSRPVPSGANVPRRLLTQSKLLICVSDFDHQRGQSGMRIHTTVGEQKSRIATTSDITTTIQTTLKNYGMTPTVNVLQQLGKALIRQAHVLPTVHACCVTQ